MLKWMYDFFFFFAIFILTLNLFSVLWIPESVCGHFLLRPSSPTSCLSSLKPSGGSAPGGTHKGGFVPRAAACHPGLIGRCCWGEMGSGRLISGRAVCLSPDCSPKTACGWLERVPSPRRPAWDLWSWLLQWRHNIPRVDLVHSLRIQKISPNFRITFSSFFFFFVLNGKINSQRFDGHDQNRCSSLDLISISSFKNFTWLTCLLVIYPLCFHFRELE